MEFEDVIEKVGSYGLYQKCKAWLMLTPVSFFVACHVSLLVFEMSVPTHWCHVPGREQTNLTYDQWKNLTLPRSQDDSGEFEKCLQYNVSHLADQVVVDNTSIPCQSGWDHDTITFTHTVATYHEWLCDREHYSKPMYTISKAGTTVGTLLLPFLADRYFGRRIMFFVAIGFMVVFNLLVLVVSNYGVHLACRFFAAFGGETALQMPYVIVQELIAPEKRTFVCFLSFVLWTAGMCIASFLVTLLTHWIHLRATVTFAGALIFLFWRFLPESPRWLLAKKRYDQCADIVRQIARTNGTPEPPKDQLIAELRKIDDKEEEGNFIEIVRYPHVILYLILILIATPCVFFVYGALFVNINVVPNNEALNFFVMSLFELPSSFVGWWACHYLGRRTGCFAGFALSAAFSAAAALSTSNRWVALGMAAFVKLFITSSMFATSLINVELFPTPIRTITLGMALVASMGISSFSPYVVELDLSLQYWLMMAVSLVGVLCTLLVPETLGLPLPQTYEEAENIHKVRPLFSLIHHWNYREYMPVSTGEELDDMNSKKKEEGGEEGQGGGEETEG